MSHENNKLSQSAQIVQDVLSQRGITFSVVELSESTRTALDAANAIGCEVGQIVKSLLFRTDITHQPVLILASGANRVDEKQLENLLGEKIVKADAAFTRDVTGFAIGGVPPVAHKQKIEKVFIDEDLINYEVLWAAAGTPYAVFSLPAIDLQMLTGGQVIALKLNKR